MTDNPLLQKSSHPNQAPAFTLFKVEHYLPAVEAAIAEARENIEAIKNNADAPSFDNVIVALECASETLGDVSGIYYNQLSAVGGDDLHALTEKIGPMSAAFGSDVSLDPVLFKKVKAVYDQKDTLGLDEEEAMLLDDTYKGFVRSGALLPADKQERLREIAQELSTLSPAFMQNVSKSSEAFEMVIDDQADLEGLPASAIEAAAFAAEERNMAGKWVFTLDFPSYGPFMQFSSNRELRERIWRAFSSRAYKDDYDNRETLMQIVSLRDERAKLLGYPSHAAFVLEERMAQTPDQVMNFLMRLKQTYKPSAERDLHALQDFAKESDGLEELMPWDLGYYGEKLKQKLFAFSSEDFRPYLPLDAVLKGCFEHFTKLFDLQFTVNNAYPLWHEDVKAFDVTEASTGRFIGTLYGDFHPRKGKKPGAWKTGYRSQGLYRGEIVRPVIAIVCNFTKPTPDRPSLLTHDEVETLFHEMGHAVHALVSDVTYRSLSGTNVKWDFVELPSQVQENWCFEKETLDQFARHYKTGEAIPAALIDKLKAAKNFLGGWMGLRQVSLGLLDMCWHMTDPATIKSVEDFEDETLRGISLFPRYGGPTSCSFSHIFAGGYSAGYYSYKWAEVLDADTFEAFLENGLYDSKTAKAYKNEVLSKGGSRPPQVLYRNFRGRDADPDALLRREGLL
jgi:peptidyl-dipeptidase Dcp